MTQIIKKYLPPFLIFLCYIATYIGFSEFRDNNYLFQPVWDIKHYLDISETGYEVYPCTQGIDGRAGDICGNTGWLPMWPMVVKAIRPILGGSSKLTFISLSFIFSFAGFIIFYLFIRKKYNTNAAIITILALICSPASFYLITGFPYALFFFLFAAYLWFLYRSPTILTEIFLFIIAIMLSLTYPTGILLALIPILKLIFDSKDKFSSTIIGCFPRILKYGAPFLLGLLLLWFYFYLKFDDFFLQLHFQEKYDRTWAIPVWIMLKSLFGASWLSPENIVILWYGLAFIIFYPYKIARELWVLALVLYLFSLTTGTTMSIYRHYLLLFPLYIIIGNSSRPLWLKLGWCAIGLASALLILLPKFMDYQLI